MADHVEFSPWYINTRRLSDIVGRQIPVAAQTSIAHNTVQRLAAMDFAKVLAQQLVAGGNVENLARLVVKKTPRGKVLAGYWGNASFSGSAAAFSASEAHRRAKNPVAKLKVQVGDDVREFQGVLEIEHFYSNSSVTQLRGQRQFYFVALFDFTRSEDVSSFVPILIGDLIDRHHGLRLPFAGLADIYPSQIDAFAKMKDVRPPARDKLLSIMRPISEEQIKLAFASIIGEPFVTKDWGGETSDLQTSRLTIDGEPMSAAFLLKGPAIKGPMHPSSLGKNGDQIPRLFDEDAELLVVQHWQQITLAVRKMMRAFAVQPERPRRYCVIDGGATYAILRAYGFINKDGAYTGSTKKRRPSRLEAASGGPRAPNSVKPRRKSAASDRR